MPHIRDRTKAGIAARGALKKIKRPQHSPNKKQHENDSNAVINNDDAVLQLRIVIGNKFALGMPATDVAELAFHISNCGLEGVADLALDPNTLSFANDASRTVTAAFNIKEIESTLVYPLIPMSTSSGTRELLPQAMACLQDVLWLEFMSAPKLILEYFAVLDNTNYLQNEIRLDCVAHGHWCVGFGMFEDGAPYKGKGAGTKGSVHNIFVNILGQTRRRCLSPFNKDLACGESCGCCCRGKCSFDAIERELYWWAFWAAQGIWAPTDNQGFEWTEPAFAKRAGTPMLYEGRQVRFCILQMRSDWDQYAAGMGFQRHNMDPFCIFCPCPRELMHDELRFAPYTHEQYIEAVNKCRVSVALNADDVRKVFAVLATEKRDDGARGVAISMQIAVWDFVRHRTVVLEVADRLELGCVRNVYCHPSDLEGGFPWRLTFWRRRADVPFQFMSWIFKFPGMRFEYLMLGDLHGVDLGPTAKLIGHTFIKVLKCGARYRNLSTEQGMKKGARMLSRELKGWYKQQRSTSRLGRVTLKMLEFHRQTDAGNLNCKAAEARQTLPFALVLLNHPRVQRALGDPGEHLLKAVTALVKAYALIRKFPRDGPARIGLCFDKVTRHSKLAGVSLIPKFHLVRHFDEICARAGGPAGFSEYADDTHNRAIVSSVAACHTSDFAARVLAREILQLRMEELWRGSRL